MFDNVTSLPMSSIRQACTAAMVMPPPPPVGEEDPGLIFLLAQHKMMHIYDAEEESPDLMKRLLTARMVDRIETDWWAKNMSQEPASPHPSRRARRPSQLSHCNGTSDLQRHSRCNVGMSANPNSNSTTPPLKSQGPLRVPPRLDASEVSWSEFTNSDNSTTL